MLDILYYGWNICNILGVLHRGYHYLHYGRDCYNMLKGVASYFGREKNSGVDMNASFLIERTEIVGRDKESGWLNLSLLR